MSSKSSPKSPSEKLAYKFFRGFTRKHRKALKVVVLGDQGVGKSAFVVRYLTRRFIGDYCSKMENTYPHSSYVDNMTTPILVWDTIYTNQEDLRDRAYAVSCWADVIIIVYSVTDLSSYNTSLSIHSILQQAMAFNMADKALTPVILVGNKNDLWYQRHVITDKACQEAKDLGFSNYFEISVKESLDQVRIVFEEAIRSVAVARRQRQGHKGSKLLLKSLSNDLEISQETSPESEDGHVTKSKVNIPTNLIQAIKKKLSSPKNSVTTCGVYISEEPEVDNIQRNRSYTYSGKFTLTKRSRKLSVFEPAVDTA